MKKFIFAILFLSVSLTIFGQITPDWLDEDFRTMKFHESVYFTGFSYGEVSGGKTLQDVMSQIKTDAQADLSRKIRLQIISHSQSEISAMSSGGQYYENESFLNRSTTESSTEVVGVKTESYYEVKTRIVYAFAYVNRNELIAYYKANLAMNLTQAESLLQIAQNLENSGEKVKARQQCEAVKLLLAKVRSAQDLLTAIDINSAPGNLLQARTEAMHDTLVQMQAQLAQAIYVYMESHEDLFGQKVDIVINKVKAELAKNGCSFVENVQQADFKLRINVSTRHSSNDSGIVFCYADTQLELYHIRKQKIVYSDEIAQKAGGVSIDKSGRKAMADVALKISEKLKPWIAN